MGQSMKCVVAALCVLVIIVVRAPGKEISGHRFPEQRTAPLYEPGKIVVKFKPNIVTKGTRSMKVTGITSFDEKLSRFSVQKVRKRFKHKPIPKGSGLPDISRIYSLSFSTDFDPVTVAREFAKDPSVEYAEPVCVPTMNEIPNDSLFDYQQHLIQIQAPQAWDVQHGDSTVVIAVLDNGIDLQHPDLHDNIWTNEVEAHGVQGVDDDGNGYVDDIHGYDLAEDDNEPSYRTHGDSHGTYVAGIAAAVTNNGIGVAGVSWNCEIMPVKTAYDSLEWQNHFAYDGIIYAAENGADVINCSWGNYNFYSQIEQNIINYAYGLGSIIVCAGGNSGLHESVSPACYVNALGVCWVGLDDVRVGTYGHFIDLCAPGSYIVSTVPVNQGSYYLEGGGGSSCASPIVAGVCGLVKSQHPDWSNDQIVRQVVLTADNIDRKNPGIEGLLGTGRVNANKAIIETQLREIPPKIFCIEKHVSDDEGGDGDGLFERGETIEVSVRYRNYSLGSAQNFQVFMKIDDPNLTVHNSTFFLGTFPPDTVLTTAPLTFSIALNARAQMTRFLLRYTADNGICGEDTIPVIIGTMPVLFVDDDNAQNNVEGYYTTALESLNVLYAMWDHVSQGSPAPFVLSNFPIIVWACEMTFPTLNIDDRTALADFLDNGGNFFISGQDIGLDFDEGTAKEDKDFYEDYLHALYYSDDSKTCIAKGIEDDVIGDGLSFNIYQPGRPHYYQFYDEIEPGLEADAVFEYVGGKNHKCGIKYEGDHKVIYFSIGFEAIDAHNNVHPTDYSPIRTEIMRRTLNWLSFLSHEPLKDSEDLGGSYAVEARVTTPVRDLTGLTLFWKKEETNSFNRLTMSQQGDDVYTAIIPPAENPSTIQYYIALETSYYEWTSPMNAPQDLHSFHVGPDRTNPQFLKIEQLPDTYDRSSSTEVTANVTDNLGIEKVTLCYQLNAGPITDAEMVPTDKPDEYIAPISWSCNFGDIVSYYIEAIDASSSHNRATSDMLSFQIVPYFLVEDFESGTESWDLGTGWGPGGFGIDLSTSITDSPEGGYSDNENNALTYEKIFDLSECTSAALSFWHYYDIEDGMDFGYVEASRDGENWTILDIFTGSLTYPHQRHCTLFEGFCGPGNEAVHIRFRLLSDEFGTADGWTIDDITMWSMVEMGDVNCDMVVDIVDVVFTVNVVLGLETGSYVDWAADFNEDDKVNIIDAVHLVNSILNPKRMVSENQGSATVDTRLKEAALSTENEFIISVHSDVPIAAAQFNLTVTEGIAIGDPVLDDQIPPMTLTSNRKEGEVIVVVYNTEGGTISPEEDLILRIPCHTQARPGDIEINGVILVGIDGNMIPVSNVKESSGGVENIPQVYFLFQNYPNPFNPVTTIEYSLPRTSEIRLEVYNTLGQLVKVLADGEQEAGHHTVQWDASDMSSGIYFYRIEAKGTSPKNQVHFRETRRMVLMK